MATTSNFLTLCLAWSCGFVLCTGSAPSRANETASAQGNATAVNITAVPKNGTGTDSDGDIIIDSTTLTEVNVIQINVVPGGQKKLRSFSHLPGCPNDAIQYLRTTNFDSSLKHHVFRTAYAVSADECANLCRTHFFCRSAGYQPSSNRCLLSYKRSVATCEGNYEETSPVDDLRPTNWWLAGSQDTAQNSGDASGDDNVDVWLDCDRCIQGPGSSFAEKPDLNASLVNASAAGQVLGNPELDAGLGNSSHPNASLGSNHSIANESQANVSTSVSPIPAHLEPASSSSVLPNVTASTPASLNVSGSSTPAAVNVSGSTPAPLNVSGPTPAALNVSGSSTPAALNVTGSNSSILPNATTPAINATVAPIGNWTQNNDTGFNRTTVNETASSSPQPCANQTGHPKVSNSSLNASSNPIPASLSSANHSQLDQVNATALNSTLLNYTSAANHTQLENATLASIQPRPNANVSLENVTANGNISGAGKASQHSNLSSINANGNHSNSNLTLEDSRRNLTLANATTSPSPSPVNVTLASLNSSSASNSSSENTTIHVILAYGGLDNSTGANVSVNETDRNSSKAIDKQIKEISTLIKGDQAANANASSAAPILENGNSSSGPATKHARKYTRRSSTQRPGNSSSPKSRSSEDNDPDV